MGTPPKQPPPFIKGCIRMNKSRSRLFIVQNYVPPFESLVFHLCQVGEKCCPTIHRFDASEYMQLANEAAKRWAPNSRNLCSVKVDCEGLF